MLVEIVIVCRHPHDVATGFDSTGPRVSMLDFQCGFRMVMS